jgi:hypothetical protein
MTGVDIAMAGEAGSKLSVLRGWPWRVHGPDRRGPATDVLVADGSAAA